MIGKAIADGFKFGFSLKRMLPYVFFNLLIFYTICDMLGRVGSSELTPEAILALTPFYSIYLFIFLFYAISQPLLVGMILHQAKNFGKKISVKKSFKFSFSVFLKSFFLFLFLSIIYVLIGFVPFIWPLLFLLFSLASFYVFPAAIVDGKKIIESFKKSFSIFKKAPLKTFLVSLVINLFSIVLIGVSFFPLIFWLAGNMFSLYQQAYDTITLARYLARLLMSPTIILFLLFPAFATAFSIVMKLGITTRLYILLKKRA